MQGRAYDNLWNLLLSVCLCALTAACPREQPWSGVPCVESAQADRERCHEECMPLFEEPACTGQSACEAFCDGYLYVELGEREDICEGSSRGGANYPIGDAACRAEFETCRDECWESTAAGVDGCRTQAGYCMETCYDDARSCWARADDSSR